MMFFMFLRWLEENHPRFADMIYSKFVWIYLVAGLCFLLIYRIFFGDVRVYLAAFILSLLGWAVFLHLKN